MIPYSLSQHQQSLDIISFLERPYFAKNSSLRAFILALLQNSARKVSRYQYLFRGIIGRLLATVINSSVIGRRSHHPTSRFPSSPTPVVITEPFSDRTGSLRHMTKEMEYDRQRNVCLQQHPDRVTHCQLLPRDQT